jgi:hypothetical protein
MINFTLNPLSFRNKLTFIFTTILFFGGLFGQSTGTIKLTDSGGTEQLNFDSSNAVYLWVTDSDLNTNSGTAETVTATIMSETETTAENVTLTETGVNTGIFSGTIAFEVSTSFTNGDSKLQVSQGDKLTGSYVDQANDFNNQATLTDAGFYSITLKSGALTASTTWSKSDSPFLVTGDVTVNSGDTLTIEAGVEVRFTPSSDDLSGGNDANRSELYVKGTLIADGTASDTIVFTSNAESPSSGDWYGIYLKDSGAHGSFTYNRIEYATYAIRSYDMYGSTSDTTRITNSRIHHSGTAIQSDYSGRYDLIENNIIHDLTSYGIYFANWSYNGAGAIRKNRLLAVDNTGIFFQAQGSFIISDNYIDGGNGDGMYIGYMKEVTVRQDTIQNKSGNGIRFDQGAIATSQWRAISNVIKDNGSIGIQANYASVTVDSNTISGHSNYGVYLSTDFNTPVTDTLRYNTIINNGNYGVRVENYAGPFVQYNDIYDHTTYDYYNNATTGDELDARYNFWGTTTTTEMNSGSNPKGIAKIYDYYDDSNKGFVNYGGYLASEATVPPNPIAGLTAVPGDQQVTLRWNQNTESDLIKYRIYHGTTSPASTIVSDVTSGSPIDTVYIHTSPTSGVTNYYRVTAIDQAENEGDYSNEASASTLLFSELDPGMVGVSTGDLQWADVDNDNDLDVLVTGDTGSEAITKLYINASGTFTLDTTFTGLYNSAAAWGDYNNDGYVDLLINGYTGSSFTTKVFTNSSTVFTELSTNLQGVNKGTADWIDYDNDGDLDILITGATDSIAVVKIYTNTNGVFTEDQTAISNMSGVSESSVALGDYDKDGDSDILLSGNTGTSVITKLYRNDSGNYTGSGISFTGVKNGSSAWGDYDSDGDLDIIITGDDGSSKITKIYQNSSGAFSDISASLTGVDLSSSRWGDLDNDGDLDLILSGSTGSASITKRYKNSSGVFTEASDSFEAISSGEVWPVDYDSDGDLDIFLTGYGNSGSTTKVYKNFLSTVNTVPSVPASLTQTVTNDSVAFTWNQSTDSETMQGALSYNIRVGTSSNNNAVLASHSDNSGFRKIVGLGNSFQDTTYTLTGLKDGSYYWNVQAVDNNYAGSQFSNSDNSFTIAYPPNAPSGLVAYPGNQVMVLRWGKNSANDLSKYNIYRGTASPANELVGTVTGGVSADTSFTDTTLSNNLTYYFRVVAIDSAGNTSAYSNEVNSIPLAPVLSVTPDTLDFDSTTTQLEFYIKNTGYGNIAWTLIEDLSWLTVSATSNSIIQTFNSLEDRNANNWKGMSSLINIDSNEEKDYGFEDFDSRIGEKFFQLQNENKIEKNVEDEYSIGEKDFIRNDGDQRASQPNTFDISKVSSSIIVNNSSSINASNSWDTDTISTTISRSGLAAGVYWGTILVSTDIGQLGYVRIKMTVPSSGDAPATPVGLVATPGDGKIVLTWSENSEIDLANYLIYADTSANPNILLSTIAAGTVTTAHTGLTIGTKYFYRISAINNVGNESNKTSDVSIVFNNSPTDILISANSVAENSAATTTVGILTSTDIDVGDTYTYSLVSGSGDTDNSSFTVSSSNLNTAVSFDYEVKSTYNIRIKTTDVSGTSYEKAFTITVTDVDDQLVTLSTGGTISVAVTGGTAQVVIPAGAATTGDIQVTNIDVSTLTTSYPNAIGAAVSVTLTGTTILTTPLTVTLPYDADASTVPTLLARKTTDANNEDSTIFVIPVINATNNTLSTTISQSATVFGYVNSKPVASALTPTLAEDADGGTAITLSGIDTEGMAMTYVHTKPTYGTLSGTAPSLTYTPNANYNGMDSFKYVVNDGLVNSDSASVSITITPINDIPVITLAYLDTISIDQSTTGEWVFPKSAETNSTNQFAITDIDDTNMESAQITITPYYAGEDTLVLGAGSEKSLAFALSGEGTDSSPYVGTYTYTGSEVLTAYVDSLSDLKYQNSKGRGLTAGLRTIALTVNDGDGNSNTVSRVLDVKITNTAPLAISAKQELNEDESIALTLSGTDVDQNSLHFMVTQLPKHGGIQGSIPSITYIPNANFFGLDSLLFIANDGITNSDTATYYFVVKPMQDAPGAFAWSSSAGDSIKITEDNLSDTYTLKWAESVDIDKEIVNYQIMVKVGNLSAKLIADTTVTELSLTYQEILDVAFENTPLLPRATIHFGVLATDGIDTVNVTGGDRMILVNRYDFLATGDAGIPEVFALHENYPNPFNPSTTLSFDLPKISNVNITIYNMLGQKVKTFSMQNASAGYHSVRWNGTNDLGERVSTGIYLYQLHTREFVKTRKMVFMK